MHSIKQEIHTTEPVSPEIPTSVFVISLHTTPTGGPDPPPHQLRSSEFPEDGQGSLFELDKRCQLVVVALDVVISQTHWLVS